MNDYNTFPMPITKWVAFQIMSDAIHRGIGTYKYSTTVEMPKTVVESVRKYIIKNTDFTNPSVSAVYRCLDEYWESIVLELKAMFFRDITRMGYSDANGNTIEFILDLAMVKNEIHLTVRSAG